MIKVAAGVIKQDDKYLLMRRAPDQSLAGQWEYPGGKVEPNERVSAALKRELKEELGIDATIGKLITSVKYQNYEIYAYNVISFVGNIKLSVHDKMEWVEFDKLSAHSQLPADRQISSYITKIKASAPQSLDTQARAFAFSNTQIPNFDETKGCWVMKYKENGHEYSKEFATQNDSYIFYLQKANEMIARFKKEYQK